MISPRTIVSVLCLACALACREAPQPGYVRLEGTSPPIADAPAARAHLLVFWATWCAPCRKETPQLQALANAPPEGLAVVVFSHDESMKQVSDYFGGEVDPAFNLRIDIGQEVARAFGVEVLPASVLIVEGRLVARFSGIREWDSHPMRKLLAKLMEQIPLSPK